MILVITLQTLHTGTQVQYLLLVLYHKRGGGKGTEQLTIREL